MARNVRIPSAKEMLRNTMKDRSEVEWSLLFRDLAHYFIISLIWVIFIIKWVFEGIDYDGEFKHRFVCWGVRMGNRVLWWNGALIARHGEQIVIMYEFYWFFFLSTWTYILDGVFHLVSKSWFWYSTAITFILTWKIWDWFGLEFSRAQKENYRRYSRWFVHYLPGRPLLFDICLRSIWPNGLDCGRSKHWMPWATDKWPPIRINVMKVRGRLSMRKGR